MSDKYADNITDEELVTAFQQGDHHAGAALAERYKKYVPMVTRPFYIIGSDSEDLVQEGMIALLSAMQTYKSERKTAFQTYAVRCIKNRIYDIISSSNTLSNVTLNRSLSIEELEADYEDPLDVPPEEIVIHEMHLESLVKLAEKKLSRFEFTVFSYYIKGLSYNEIAQRCSKPVKAVDSALQRIRKKLSKTKADI